jgi:hypothetical protein
MMHDMMNMMGGMTWMWDWFGFLSFSFSSSRSLPS